jgi:puromycin-sensitive aminopeptidase
VLAAAVPVLAFTGDAARFDDFLNRFRSARTPQEEQRYLLSLALFRQPALIDRTLALSLSGDVRTQDAPFLLRALLLNLDSRERAWAFVRQNWDEIAKRFPVPGLKRLVEGVQGLVSPEWEQEVRAFFRERPPALGGKTLEQYLEQLHVLVRLREREGTALRQYLGESS